VNKGNAVKQRSERKKDDYNNETKINYENKKRNKISTNTDKNG
jgi:hypothetical protein